MRSDRIPAGGGFFDGASLKREWLFRDILKIYISSIAETKPIIGEMIRDKPASVTFSHSG